MDTVTLTIDGRQVTVEKGKTMLQAAIEHGISVPYYCYHPGISIDGSCRVCIVKIEKMPKLQTSCSTICTDGNNGSGLEAITTRNFNRPVPARHWLQASNPSERWKWDFMFQDLPPVKGDVDPTALPLPPGAIQLKEVK